MESAPDPGDTKDFRFEKQQELLAWTSQAEIPSAVVRGLAVSNKFGLAVCLCENGFLVMDCNEPNSIVTNAARQEQPKSMEETGRAFLVNLRWQGLFVAISTSGLTLAVCVVRDGLPVAFLYDMRSVTRRDPNTQPFQTVQLSSSPNVTVLDFSWIPTPEEIFVAVLSNGSLGLFEIKQAIISVLGFLNESTQASCVSWSPKGKQFVIGKFDGTLSQYKPDLSQARAIPAPKGHTVSVKSVIWLSTFVFAAAYKKSDEAQPLLVVVDAPKTGDAVFTNFDDICTGYSDQRAPFFHFLPVFEWSMVLVASSTGLEVPVLASQSHDMTTGWLQLMLEETARAELPLVGDEETSPMGIALLTFLPVPVLLIATTHGLIVPFKVVNLLKRNGAPYPSIRTPAESISQVIGERPQLALPALTPTPTPTPTQPAFGGQSQAEEKKSPFSSGITFGGSLTSSPLSQSTNQLQFGSLFSGNKSGQKAQDSAFSSFNLPPAAQPVSSHIGQPSSVPVPSSGAGGGQIGDGKETQWGTKPALLPTPVEVPKTTTPPVTSTVHSSKFPTAATTTSSAHKPSGPCKIPSQALQEFLKKVAAHGKTIEAAHPVTAGASSSSDAELEEQMNVMARVLQDVTQHYTEAAAKLSEQERLIDERIHVVEEAMLVVQRCSDPQFVQCLRLLPLDPMQRRKHEILQQQVDHLENKLKSIHSGVELELNLLEKEKSCPEENRDSMTGKLVQDLHSNLVNLQRRLDGIETESCKITPKKHVPTQQPVVSPAELVSRLYPILHQESARLLTKEAASKLRNKLKFQPVRVTKHQVGLPQQRQPASGSSAFKSFTPTATLHTQSPAHFNNPQKLSPVGYSDEKAPEQVTSPLLRSPVTPEAVTSPNVFSSLEPSSFSSSSAWQPLAQQTDVSKTIVPETSSTKSDVSGIKDIARKDTFPLLANPVSQGSKLTSTSAAGTLSKPASIFAQSNASSTLSADVSRTISSPFSGGFASATGQASTPFVALDQTKSGSALTNLKSPNVETAPNTSQASASWNLSVGASKPLSLPFTTATADPKPLLATFGTSSTTTANAIPSLSSALSVPKPAEVESKALFGKPIVENKNLFGGGFGSSSGSSVFGGGASKPAVSEPTPEPAPPVTSSFGQVEGNAPAASSAVGFLSSSTPAANPQLSSLVFGGPSSSSGFGNLSIGGSTPSPPSSQSGFTTPVAAISAPQPAKSPFGFSTSSSAAFGSAGFSGMSVRSPQAQSSSMGTFAGSSNPFAANSSPFSSPVQQNTPTTSFGGPFGGGSFTQQSVPAATVSQQAPSVSSFGGFKVDSNRPVSSGGFVPGSTSAFSGSGFGSPGAFGSSQPSFGGSAFGQPGAFGSSSPFGGGSGGASSQPMWSTPGAFGGAFGQYTPDSNVSFGALAAQQPAQQAPGFGSVAPHQQQQPGGFGFPGGHAGSSMSGAPAAASPQSKAFMQYR